MLSTVIGALLPIVITLGLGYLAGWHHDFTGDQAATLNRMVMLYALPLSLFVGMATTPRHELTESGGLALAIGGSMVVSFFVTLLAAWRIWHQDLGTASLYGLAVGGPSVPFVGTSVLEYLFGAPATIPISVASLALNLVQVPVCLVLLGTTSTAEGNATVPAGDRSADQQVMGDIVSALREPVVWAPVLGLLLALTGIELPVSVDRGLALLGATTGGVALFASGVVLYAQQVLFNKTIGALVIARNLLVPAGLWAVLLLVGMDRVAVHESVVTLAIPTASVTVILAVRFRTAERVMASTLFYSTILSLLTLAGFIALTD
jgi:malonate transporter